AHASLVNNGSIRRELPAGPITYGMLYELQPFQNELVTVEVTGADLRVALENSLGVDGGANAHISGMTVSFDPAAPAGSRTREIRLTDGRVVGATDRITLGVSEFLASGGDRYASLRNGVRRGTGIVDLDALIQYLQSLPQPVQAPTTGRWAAIR
ncbi:MAG: 5'-nucleotidase C-terminal domain-containing protein, partial [Gemmatimonadota bacterium]|nr:5'-nucleotidase C-terminal domain-containing protein [Gemmatimonadota bacterium]